MTFLTYTAFKLFIVVQHYDLFFCMTQTFHLEIQKGLGSKKPFSPQVPERKQKAHAE